MEQKNKNQKKDTAKYIKLIIMILILVVIILFFIKMCKKDEYSLEKNPKLNMITLNEILETSHVCNDDWKNRVNKLKSQLDEDNKVIDSMEVSSDRKKELQVFIMLQKEVANALDNMLLYLEENEYLDKIELVDNLRVTYNSYKTYYDNTISKGSTE